MVMLFSLNYRYICENRIDLTTREAVSVEDAAFDTTQSSGTSKESFFCSQAISD
jgi:hypothetical protein